MNMRKAISITLEDDNLLWLRGQAAQTTRGSVSDVLDRIVGEARTAGWADPATVKSVAGTVDLPDDDPDLAEADAYIRSMFAASSQRPMLVREKAAAARARKTPRG